MADAVAIARVGAADLEEAVGGRQRYCDVEPRRLGRGAVGRERMEGLEHALVLVLPSDPLLEVKGFVRRLGRLFLRAFLLVVGFDSGLGHLRRLVVKRI